jgi:RNA polymerase subunit RPABC4/transcription elongation factor Spt4
VIDGKCPHCKKQSFDSKWNNIHVVTDETAIRLKESRREEE